MEWAIAIISALLGAVVGGGVGHSMTVRLFNERANLHEKALYSEFEIILEKYVKDLPVKLSDFSDPIKESYVTSVPILDMSIVDAISVELTGTNKVLNKEVRKLVAHTRQFSVCLVDLAVEREKVNNFSEQDTKKFIAITKQMIVIEIQMIFYMHKLITERENFHFGDYSNIEMAKVASELGSIPFSQYSWNTILPREKNS
ncbi:hypothetical protein LZI70_16265 [Vibrio pelagius]|uniref:Uncharacterized protein n=1 Tax=Vibrio pelagius TaxID=28169 RepID=A0ABY5G9X5_VIBPE|nr:hypothetical protein [Vibrio pelagius]UTT86973.1 hypothetical protein LZI70_16265 [Vibrio pelagius]